MPGDVEGVTVTVQESVKLPSLVVAVIVAVPTETPVTSPELFTVATDSSLLVQVTFLLVASSGMTLAATSATLPISTVSVAGVTSTPVTGTGGQFSMLLWAWPGSLVAERTVKKLSAATGLFLFA